MALSSSHNPTLPHLGPDDRLALLEVASASITHSLHHQQPMPVDPDHFTAPLRVLWATFVTLKLKEGLRGCIGTLEAVAPLVESVARNASAAALQDPRFPPVTAAERDGLVVHISILSEPQPLHFANEPDLLRQLRVGVDGLIIEEASHRGTLLPSVWDSVPEPAQFVQQLKVKAGLAPDYWSPNLKVLCYTIESVP